MTGTFGGALEARGIPAGDGFLHSETVGELEKEGNVLVIKRIHVSYKLKVDSALREEKADAIQRALDLHADSCPVYRSIYTSIDITKDLEFVEG
ncbi:MAG: OsmC family protein [Chloroflexi bacterium]|jgi:uncharacterized OsmC-like protein|nr:OsmC family protein [Chloroflexota bacterium]